MERPGAGREIVTIIKPPTKDEILDELQSVNVVIQAIAARTMPPEKRDEVLASLETCVLSGYALGRRHRGEEGAAMAGESIDHG